MSSPPIPANLSDITAGWLSAALSANGSPTEVIDMRLERIGTGQAGSTYRATLTHASKGVEQPDTVVVKLPAQDPSLRAGLAPGYRSEIAFYAKVADTIRAPIPRCFYHGINDEGTEFALLLSDLDPSAQGDQIGGCSDRQAHLVVEALAGLHGPSWCDPIWLDLAEVAMPKPGDDAAAKLMGDAAQIAVDMVLDRLGSRLAPEDHGTLRSAMEAVQPWLASQPRFSLMHGDFRADNLMFHPSSNAVTIVDWQTIGVGLAARDLAYFTASSLTPHDRRRMESALVEHYHAALLGHGVGNYDLQTCWRDYCVAMIQPPMISLLGCAFASPTARGDEMFVHTLKQSSLAIRELNTLEFVDAT